VIGVDLLIPSIEVTTGFLGSKPALNSKSAIEVTTGFLQPLTPPELGRKCTASVSEAYRELIELELSRGRNAMGIWQDLVDRHGFTGGYQSVKRFVRKLHGAVSPEARTIIETRPGEECQVDYGTGPMVRDPDSGKYRRTRLFVLTLGSSRKCVRLLAFRSSARMWAELHEKAFRRLGGSPRIAVLDNLREGVLSPDFYDPGLNPLYRDVLAHYGVTALPCKVRDPDRKGKVESGVAHAQKTPMKGKKFESLEEAQSYLDHWEEHWADKRIHGRTKRQVAAMFAEEKPFLQALPLEPFRYYQYGERTVHLDGCVEVEAAYYGAPPGWIGRQVHVQWDSMFVRLLDPKTGELLREHLSGKRGGHRIRDADRPRRTPLKLLQLLARAHKAGPNIGAVSDAIHARQGELGMRRIQGMLQLAKKYGSAATDDACAAALELRVTEYRFVRRYLERRPQAPLSLRQVDPLIRELTEYRDLIQQRIHFEETNP
jgi:transposase